MTTSIFLLSTNLLREILFNREKYGGFFWKKF
jgi:hypothetical protein